MATPTRMSVGRNVTRKLFSASMLDVSRVCSFRFSSQSPEADNQPIKFSTSKAATWKAKYTLEGDNDSPPLQGRVVGLSLAALLIYFCILREENDIDEKFRSVDLWRDIPGLEEQSRKAAIVVKKSET